MKAFIDTNIFIKFLTDAESNKIEQVIASGEACTSFAVLNELKFKLLYKEASKHINSEKKYEVIKEIKRNTEIRRKVYSFYSNFYKTLRNSVKILGYDEKNESISIKLSEFYGLLPTDSSILACMLTNGYKTILTTDSDFEKIKGIKVIKP